MQQKCRGQAAVGSDGERGEEGMLPLFFLDICPFFFLGQQDAVQEEMRQREGVMSEVERGR